MSTRSDPPGLSRRALLGGAVALAATATGVLVVDRLWQPYARVCTLRADSYEIDLVDLLLRGIREFPDTVARAKGARVVLKPNLVEYDQSRPINTNPRLVASAAEAFRQLGAAEVVVAEGPGHRRDTELLVGESGLQDVLHAIRAPFVDLNADSFTRVALSANHTGLGTLPVAATVLGADLLVSVAKMKTHHWAGATLSMKNLFGTVPGVAVGWPKNVLHWGGIEQSIVDLWHAVQPRFAIIDGIVGMEGDGPIRGTAVDMRTIVLGEQCPAVDAVAARLMGLDPRRMPYLAVAAGEGGTIAASRIEVVGDVIAPRPFALLEKFEKLRAD